MPGNVDSKVYEFKDFHLDVAQQRLLHQGQPVSLKPKVLDLLRYLIERRNQLVTKEDLMRDVWPDTIVEENNITVSMSILRKILGEAPDKREFIETIPRRGYRFLAEVKEFTHSRPEPDGDNQSPSYNARREELIDSIAVLPIDSESTDPSVEYLGEGITESLINTLSRIRKLRVLACSTVLRFKGKVIDPQSVGVRLNVTVVLMIRVIRVGEKLVIRSELVKVADGSQLWGEQYNRSPSDILAIQEEIANAIAESLKFKLTQQDKVSLAKKPTENIEAFNLYLRGRYFWNKYDKEWVLKGIDAFRQAIAIDQRYALAYCGLADAYFRLSNLHFPPREVLPKAREAALKAMEIDDSLAEAHSSLALISVYYDHNWDQAEHEFRRALELNPDLLSAHQRYGSYLTFMGRFEEALRHYDAALDLDPFSLQTNMNVATVFYLRGEYDRAVNHLIKTSELEPNYMPTHFVLACTYLQQGRLTEAIAEFQRIYKLDDEAYMAIGFMGYAHALAGQRDEAQTLLNILEDISTRKYVSPYSMLVINLAIGPEERIFELLDQLYEECNDWLVWLKVSPELKPLVGHPRFKLLMKRVGFSQ